MKAKPKAFTLIELLVVVVIIGILAAIALPRYSYIVERSRQREAVINLGIIRGAQMRYIIDNDSDCATNFTALDVDDPTTTAKYFNYTVAGASTAAYVATAVRNAAQNPGYGSYTVSINRNGDLTVSGGTNPPQP